MHSATKIEKANSLNMSNCKDWLKESPVNKFDAAAGKYKTCRLANGDSLLARVEVVSCSPAVVSLWRSAARGCSLPTCRLRPSKSAAGKIAVPSKIGYLSGSRINIPCQKKAVGTVADNFL